VLISQTSPESPAESSPESSIKESARTCRPPVGVITVVTAVRNMPAKVSCRNPPLMTIHHSMLTATRWTASTIVTPTRASCGKKARKEFQEKYAVAFAHHRACCRVDVTSASLRSEYVLPGDTNHEEVTNPDGRIDDDRRRGGLSLLRLVLSRRAIWCVPADGPVQHGMSSHGFV